MRKSLVAVATTGVLSLGAFGPSAFAQSSTPSTDTRAQSASRVADVGVRGENCDRAYWEAALEYVYAYDGKDCKDPIGKDKDNDSNWSEDSNDKASSLLNRGVGPISKVQFFRLADYAGGSACLSQGEKYADDLGDNKFSDGKKVNNRISSHKWVANSKDCAANLT